MVFIHFFFTCLFIFFYLTVLNEGRRWIWYQLCLEHFKNAAHLKEKKQLSFFLWEIGGSKWSCDRYMTAVLYSFSTVEPRSWLQLLQNFVPIITIITIIVFIIIIFNNYTESPQVIFIPTAINHPEVHRILLWLIFSTIRFISKIWIWNYISFFHTFSHVKNRPIKKLESGTVINSCTYVFFK